jgi:hypothetical protein
MVRSVSDSELARAIESSPFHQLAEALQSDTLAKAGCEIRDLAREMTEFLGDMAPASDDDDDDAPTVVMSEAERRFFRRN